MQWEWPDFEVAFNPHLLPARVPLASGLSTGAALSWSTAGHYGESPGRFVNVRDEDDACARIAAAAVRARMAASDNRSTGYGASISTNDTCLLYTSPSPRDGLLSRMPSSA